MRWLYEIEKSNRIFTEQIVSSKLPTERQSCDFAIITCMDPRINLAAVGVKPFTLTGESQSDVRVIRTIGGIPESRSLVIGIHLAGFKEIAVVMHTDCGCSIAHHKIDVIIENLVNRLSAAKLSSLKALIGEPFKENLREWLHTFEDPRTTIKNELNRLKQLPYVPDSIILHGLLYHLSTGVIETIVNGYEEA